MVQQSWVAVCTHLIQAPSAPVLSPSSAAGTVDCIIAVSACMHAHMSNCCLDCMSATTLMSAWV